LLILTKGCGYAIGVSKRCCPVCSYLLRLLNEHCGAKFVISDEHTYVSPCALPVWLPENIVRLMVLEFSGRLREELIKLQVESKNQLRGRADTSHTARISIDSIGSLGGSKAKEADDIDAFEWTGKLETQRLSAQCQ
jgi:hypothetical protein